MTADDSGKLTATEPINAGRGIASADGESDDVTMTLASEPYAAASACCEMLFKIIVAYFSEFA